MQGAVSRLTQHSWRSGITGTRRQFTCRKGYKLWDPQCTSATRPLPERLRTGEATEQCVCESVLVVMVMEAELRASCLLSPASAVQSRWRWMRSWPPWFWPACPAAPWSRVLHKQILDQVCLHSAAHSLTCWLYLLVYYKDARNTFWAFLIFCEHFIEWLLTCLTEETLYVVNTFTCNIDDLLIKPFGWVVNKITEKK